MDLLNKMMRSMWRFASILGLCLGLNACHTQPQVSSIMSLPTLPLHESKARDSSIPLLTTKLENQHVRFITQGENTLASIPAQDLFYEQSPRIHWKSYSLLNDMAAYLRLYRKVSVQVTAYTLPYKSTQRERALSKARANAVAHYLWSQGINARFIYAYGEGAGKPILDKSDAGERSINSRIEITFRRLVA